MFITNDVFGQFKYDFSYRPEKQEIEAEISYIYKDYKFSCIYNNDEYLITHNLDKFIIYGCIYSPIYDDIDLKTQIGYGKYFDFEITINYKFYNFEIDIGYSYTDNFIIEISYEFKR